MSAMDNFVAAMMRGNNTQTQTPQQRSGLDPVTYSCIEAVWLGRAGNNAMNCFEWRLTQDRTCQLSIRGAVHNLNRNGMPREALRLQSAIEVVLNGQKLSRPTPLHPQSLMPSSGIEYCPSSDLRGYWQAVPRLYSQMPTGPRPIGQPDTNSVPRHVFLEYRPIRSTQDAGSIAAQRAFYNSIGACCAAASCCFIPLVVQRMMDIPESFSQIFHWTVHVGYYYHELGKSRINGDNEYKCGLYQALFEGDPPSSFNMGITTFNDAAIRQAGESPPSPHVHLPSHPPAQVSTTRAGR